MKVVQAVFSRLQVQTLLLLDDLHWATPESLALFKRVVDGVGQRRMMVIGSVRSEERPAWLYGLEALELSLPSESELLGDRLDRHVDPVIALHGENGVVTKIYADKVGSHL